MSLTWLCHTGVVPPCPTQPRLYAITDLVQGSKGNHDPKIYILNLFPLPGPKIFGCFNDLVLKIPLNKRCQILKFLTPYDSPFSLPSQFPDSSQPMDQLSPHSDPSWQPPAGRAVAAEQLAVRHGETHQLSPKPGDMSKFK